MESDFWLDVWEVGNIGFHQSKVNAFLETYAKKTFKEQKTIFVPLCGKSLDMLWLQEHGYSVIGVEIAKKAVIDFFEENKITYTLEKTPLFDIYTNGTLKIYQGSFFDMKKEDLGECDIYDRASIVALPKEMRQAYGQKIIELSSKSTNILLQTFEHEKDIQVGPPFCVTQKEVDEHFSENFDIKLIQKAKRPLPDRYKDAGVKKIEAVVYHLKAKE